MLFSIGKFRPTAATLIPEAGLVQGESQAQWTVEHGSPRFRVSLSEEIQEGGWFLLRTSMIRRTAGYSAALYCQIDAKEKPIPIPVSFKGNVIELVNLPVGTEALYWSPMSAAGELTQHPIELSRVGTVERIYRMLRRIVPMFLNERKEKLRALGVGHLSVFRDIETAYKVAGRLRAYGATPDYREWMVNVEKFCKHDGAPPPGEEPVVGEKAKCLAIVRCDEAGEELVRRSVDTLRQAGVARDSILLVGAHEPLRGDYAKWCVNVAEHQLGKMLSAEANKYALCIMAGDEVSCHLQYWLEAAVASCPTATLVYFDHDSINSYGERTDPNFKPDWSPELLRSTNYIGRAFVLRTGLMGELCSQIGNPLPDPHILLLMATAAISGKQIRHIPAVLLHQHKETSSITVRQLQDTLSGMGVDGKVQQEVGGCFRVKYRLPAKLPKVSILIPTRNAVELLEQCVSSLLGRSSYNNYEVLIIDNCSSDTKALEYLKRIDSDVRVKVLRYDAPFNFSAINNFAARKATGEVLCLLNNDTEVISPDWLEEMLGHLIQPEVGVVGAKLFYPDGRVQHGGDVVGVGGVANHLHAFLGTDDPGYCNRAIVAQDLSAVTAACLLTWRRLFMKLGGLEEAGLPVAFNDVDYCLRVREAGCRVVWTPHAQLFHHESVSRGKDNTPAKKARAKKEVNYMRKRWRRELRHDHFYNPNLNSQRADFSLSQTPMIWKPRSKPNY